MARGSFLNNSDAGRVFFITLNIISAYAVPEQASINLASKRICFRVITAI